MVKHDLPLHGETLLQYRVRMGYKRASDLAERLGVNASAISRLEAGDGARHPVVKIQLAAFFGLTGAQVDALVRAGSA